MKEIWNRIPLERCMFIYQTYLQNSGAAAFIDYKKLSVLVKGFGIIRG